MCTRQRSLRRLQLSPTWTSAAQRCHSQSAGCSAPCLRHQCPSKHKLTLQIYWKAKVRLQQERQREQSGNERLPDAVCCPQEAEDGQQALSSDRKTNIVSKTCCQHAEEVRVTAIPMCERGDHRSKKNYSACIQLSRVVMGPIQSKRYSHLHHQQML